MIFYKIKSSIVQLSILAIVFIVLSFILVTSINKIGGNEFIWIEAEDAEFIKYPLKKIKNKSASKGLAVVSLGESHITEGTAKYDIIVQFVN